ncbi:hypothetical protein TCE0_022r06744 [Talaromyces pinophilus]|uniref:Uncharacterized protein n=1 Tax=Talaromyces pinophilus TaxID=128442 RepID=A0A6V8HAG6_TALPI|nr:hypothetical protein TCE0_022r06744 [Talaromyces pinophilus]
MLIKMSEQGISFQGHLRIDCGIGGDTQRLMYTKQPSRDTIAFRINSATTTADEESGNELIHLDNLQPGGSRIGTSPAPAALQLGPLRGKRGGYNVHLISNCGKCQIQGEFIDSSEEFGDSPTSQAAAPKALLPMKTDGRNHLEMWFVTLGSFEIRVGDDKVKFFPHIIEPVLEAGFSNERMYSQDELLTARKSLVVLPGQCSEGIGSKGIAFHQDIDILV